MEWVKDVFSDSSFLKAASPLASYLSLGFLILLVSWWRWRNKIDNESIIISLNTPLIDKSGSQISNSLRMFTLLNCRLREVIENRFAQKFLLRAGKKTTIENPFINLEKNKFSILTLLLNDISSIFALWFVAKDMGAPVIEEEYIMALTRERYPKMRWETTRVMLVKKSWLVETNFTIIPPFEWNLQYPHHHWRIETLRKMKEDFLKGEGSQYCLVLSLVVPKL